MSDDALVPRDNDQLARQMIQSAVNQESNGWQVVSFRHYSKLREYGLGGMVDVVFYQKSDETAEKTAAGKDKKSEQTAAGKDEKAEKTAAGKDKKAEKTAAGKDKKAEQTAAGKDKKAEKTADGGKDDKNVVKLLQKEVRIWYNADDGMYSGGRSVNTTAQPHYYATYGQLANELRKCLVKPMQSS